MEQALTLDRADRPASETRRQAMAKWGALGVLVLVVGFASLDRVALPLLAERIRISLRLNDVRLGLLQDTGGAIFAAVAAFPIAWLADRYDRRWVLGACLVTWSAAAALCGCAPSFAFILAASSFLAAGGAGVAPIAQSYIGVLFVGKARQYANSTFLFGMAASASLAMIGVGQLTRLADGTDPSILAGLHLGESWRLVFLCVAAPAPLLLFALPLLPRLRREAPAARPAATGEAPRESVVHLFVHQPALLIGAYGSVGLFIFGQAAISTWLNVICLRYFAQSPAQVGGAMGLVGLLALPTAYAINLALTPFLVRRYGPAAPVRFLRWAFLLSAGLLLILLLARTAMQVYATFLVLDVVIMAAGMNLPGIFQSLGPPSILARLFALGTVVNTAAAAAAGPLVGLVSDSLKSTPMALLVAAAVISAAGAGAAGLVLIVFEPSFARHARGLEANP